MTSIPEHIKNLLFEQDCVVVPDFGGFIANFHGSSAHDTNGTLLPPRKRIAFNEVLQFDDGLLSSYVAVNEAKSRDEALLNIRSFAEHIRQELKLRKSFRFDNLGIFTLNTEGKLVFEPDNKINYHAESYGMVPVSPRLARKLPTEAKLIPRSTFTRTEVRLRGATPSFVGEETSPRRWLTLPNLAAAAAIALISLLGWYMFDAGNSALSSLNPLTVLDFKEWLTKAPLSTGASVKPTGALASTPQPVVREADEFVEIDLTVRSTKAVDSPLLKPAKEATPQPVSAPAARPAAVALSVRVHALHVKTGVGKTPVATGHYFVVAGGFVQKSNALKFQRKVQSQRYSNVSVLYPSRKGTIKVTVGEYDNLATASHLANRVRTAFGNNVWVLKSK